MKSDVSGSYYTINVSSWQFKLESNDNHGFINGFQTSEVEKKIAATMRRVPAVILIITFPVVHSVVVIKA